MIIARTYKSEGRRITNALQGVVGFISCFLYFYVFTDLHWSFLVMFLLAGVIIAELAGQKWTAMRRQSAKSNRNRQTTRGSQSRRE